MRSGPRPATASQLEEYLRTTEQQTHLRFITCGSVDDGKSTLIGRLLYDSKQVTEDHLASLTADSRTVGTQGDHLDFALLVDGLAAEREQGITIDIAYRFFSTPQRKFVVADTPGHEQYTRNMITAASRADLAVLLVDARHGLLTQTRRHAYLASLFRIPEIILAVNKLDLVGYSKEVFDAIEKDFRVFAAQVGLESTVCIPVSALHGDNITELSHNMPWYSGPTLIAQLETVKVQDLVRDAPMRMPVQLINRVEPSVRGLAGTITAGSVRPGDPVQVLPSGQASTVGRLVTFDGDLDEAVTGQSLTVTLSREIDVGRGDVLVAAVSPPRIADQFEAHIVWMDSNHLAPGRSYLMKIGSLVAGITVARPKYKVNINTLEHTAATTLVMNEIGVCNVRVDRMIPYEPYVESRDMGGFIIIDRLTNDTVGAGLLHFALRRSDNVQWQKVAIDKLQRSVLNGHSPCVVWFTGLSGAGKSTIANIVELSLHDVGRHTYLLDGDNLRHGLNKDLGFTEADRIENIRRVAEVAALMADAGLIVLVALISPYRAERRLARELLSKGEFCEVFVDSTLAVAERRDPKGLYRKARLGQLVNFTGVDSPYEAPESPEVRVDTSTLTPVEAAEAVLKHLRSMAVVSSG
ncbi:MAG TPA: sulfate adenylyltransferase subunit CysN [Candidatus Dormibacteraeota bacterium]|nr:sulfate adenylyltransferase subunit CysN [Candidatus Dormibacteraeota bacterium]